MIFYWIIRAFAKFIWFFRIPKVESFAHANLNEQCPCCGFRDGRIRCVHKIKPGPRAPDRMPETFVLRQHTCNLCGARWFHEPIAKKMTAELVYPCIPRNDLEAKEDRAVLVNAESTTM